VEGVLIIAADASGVGAAGEFEGGLHHGILGREQCQTNPFGVERQWSEWVAGEVFSTLRRGDAESGMRIGPADLRTTLAMGVRGAEERQTNPFGAERQWSEWVARECIAD
jgi:hypothetical protein